MTTAVEEKSSVEQIEQEPQLKRELGLFSAVAIVSGVMIGSGIFIVPTLIAREMPSPGLLLAIWIFTAFLTVFGAKSYGKLAVAHPEAGGQYVFLKKAWGELPAFLYGWALFFVIQTGFLAAVAVAFAKFAGVFTPAISSDTTLLSLGAMSLSSQQALAIVVIMVLAFYNCKGVKEGAIMQNIFTSLKVISVAGLVAVGFFAVKGSFPNPSQWTFTHQHTFDIPFLSAFAVATVGAIFSADAWNNVTFIGGEIKDPKINLPKAMTYGTILVLVLYILANLAYLNMLPFDAIQNAPEDRVATAAISQILGPVGKNIMAVIILISTFGCLNGLTLAGARVFYAMAKDRLFFVSFGRIHEGNRTPMVALIGQGIWGGFLTLTGSYGQLLDYIIFTALLFYVLTVVGLFKLAKNDPERYQLTSWTSYIVPVTYIAMVSFVAINLAIYKPGYTLPGLGIVCAGIPIYFVWKAVYTKRVVQAA